MLMSTQTQPMSPFGTMTVSALVTSCVYLDVGLFQMHCSMSNLTLTLLMRMMDLQWSVLR